MTIRDHHRRAHALCLSRAEWHRDDKQERNRQIELARRSRLALQAHYQANYQGAERRKEQRA